MHNSAQGRSSTTVGSGAINLRPLNSLEGNTLR